MHLIFSVQVWKPKAEQECILIGEDSWPEVCPTCPALPYSLTVEHHIILSILSILYNL